MQITFAGRFNQATGLSLPYWNFTYLTTDEAYHGILLFYLIFSALLSFASAWIVSKLKRFWPFLLLAVPFMAGTYYLVDETIDFPFFLLTLSVVGAAASAMYCMPRAKRQEKEDGADCARSLLRSLRSAFLRGGGYADICAGLSARRLYAAGGLS